MGLTGNFEQATLAGDVLTISGTSSGMPGCELVSRNVAINQNGHIAHGATNLDLKTWSTGPLAAAGFEAGDGAAAAVALGCETYLAENIDDLPTYLTFTWSQTLPIAGT